MVKFFLFLHIFTLSWSSVLRISDWAPLPVITLFSLAFCMVVAKIFNYQSNNDFPVTMNLSDILIILALILMLMNLTILPSNKGANYFLAYSSIFGAYLVCIWFSYGSIKIHYLLRANFYGINFICCLVIIEIVSRLLIGINIVELIPRAHEVTAIVTPGLYRAYAFASEPTHLGNYFCCFSPYAIYYAYKENIKNLRLYIFILFCAAVLTFSVTMILVFFCSSLLFFLMVNSKLKFLKNLFYIGLIFLVLIFVLANYFQFYEIIYGAYTTIIEKLSLDDGSTSVNQRLTLIERGITDILKNPFLGIGLGSYGSQGLPSNINWYLFLASEAGLIILFLYVMWFSIHFLSALIKYKKTLDEIYIIAAVSIFSGMAYLFFLSTFQNLYLLTSILLYRLIIKSNSYQGKKVNSN